jgi:hypothetical protein
MNGPLLDEDKFVNVVAKLGGELHQASRHS